MFTIKFFWLCQLRVLESNNRYKFWFYMVKIFLTTLRVGIKLKRVRGRDKRIITSKKVTLFHTSRTKICIFEDQKLRSAAMQERAPLELCCHWAWGFLMFPVLCASSFSCPFHWALGTLRDMKFLDMTPLPPSTLPVPDLKRWLWAKGILNTEQWGRHEAGGSHTTRTVDKWPAGCNVTPG